MPKTATGKVQRRLVAKTMVEGENEKRGSESAESATSVEKKEGPAGQGQGRPGVSALVFGTVMRLCGCCMPRKK